VLATQVLLPSQLQQPIQKLSCLFDAHPCELFVGGSEHAYLTRQQISLPHHYRFEVDRTKLILVPRKVLVDDGPFLDRPPAEGFRQLWILLAEVDQYCAALT
jgi:hypothetical protein